MSKLWGRHTAKFGASYRKIGVKNFAAGQSSGSFFYDGQFTSADPLNADEQRPVCAGGVPARISVERRHRRWRHHECLHQLLRRVCPGRLPGQLQPDGQRSACATSSSRACRRRTTRLTVGFDRDRPWPFQIPGGPELKGGLQYAGVDGYPTHQSDPSKTKFAPRVGFAWTLDPKTVVRGGYGLFWAPHQYAGISSTSLGTRGFTAGRPTTWRARTAA